MFFRYDFRDMLENLFYSWPSVDLWFLMNIFEMLEELSFNIIVLFQPFSLLTLNLCDVVVHYSLYGGAVKEFRILLSFF